MTTGRPIGPKNRFMRAIGMELDALSDQLSDASLQEVMGSTARVELPWYRATVCCSLMRTSVFTSQIGKLRDVTIRWRSRLFISILTSVTLQTNF